MASLYTKQCQQIVSDYRDAGGAWPAKKTEIVEWALQNKRWNPSREDIRRMCGDAIVEGMREEVFTDEKGRSIRAKLPAKTTRDGEQGTFWDDLRTAPLDFVQISVAQRRNGIVAECYHLNNMVRYFNEHHGEGEQIELSLEFTKDVRELDQPLDAKAAQVIPSAPSATERPKRFAPPQPVAPASVSPRVPSRLSYRPRTPEQPLRGSSRVTRVVRDADPPQS